MSSSESTRKMSDAELWDDQQIAADFATLEAIGAAKGISSREAGDLCCALSATTQMSTRRLSGSEGCQQKNAGQ
jgi:hypothetical protein